MLKDGKRYAQEIAGTLKSQLALTDEQAGDIERNYLHVANSIRRRLRWEHDRLGEVASCLAQMLLDGGSPVRRSWTGRDGRLLRYAEIAVERELRLNDSIVVCPVARPSRDSEETCRQKSAARMAHVEPDEDIPDDHATPLEILMSLEQERSEKRVLAQIKRHVPLLLARARGESLLDAAPGTTREQRASVVRRGLLRVQSNLRRSEEAITPETIDEFAEWVAGWRMPRKRSNDPSPQSPGV